MKTRPIDANALQELCNRGIQNMWNTGVAPVSWAEAYADFKNDIDSIPTLTPQNEWISADERLPDNKGEYLVAYHPCHWDFVSDEIRVGLDSFRGKTAWAKKKYQRVTHWMPLPEPPDSRPPEGEEDT